MSSVTDGLLLALLGMGTVFVFLIIMIGWVRFSAKMCSSLSGRFPNLFDTSHLDPAPRKPAKKKAVTKDSGAPVAVIAAAIHRYREEHGQ